MTGWLKNSDARKVPPYEKYDENSGQDLGKYLIQFEEYCDISFRGERNWIGCTRKTYNWKTFEACKSLKGVDDTYDELTKNYKNGMQI